MPTKQDKKKVRLIIGTYGIFILYGFELVLTSYNIKFAKYDLTHNS